VYFLNLHFNSLEISYFGSFVKQHFVFYQYGPGLHFLQGRNEYEPQLGANGSGKSTLFNAMSWCLFGKTIDGRRNTDVSPWVHSGKTQVTLKLNKDEITRTISPNRLLINDKVTGPEDIEKLIGVSFELFSHTILLGQGQPLFFDLAPSDAMRILAAALNSERWAARSKIASERTNELQSEYDHKSGEVSALDGLLDHLELTITTANKKADEWAAARKERLEEQEAELATLEKQFKTKQKLLDTATLSEEGKATEIKALVKEIDYLKSAINKANSERSNCTIEIRYLATEIKRLDKERHFIAESKTCPTCGQNIKPINLKEHVAEIKKDFLGKRRQVSELKTKMAGIDPAKDVEKLKIAQAAYEDFKSKHEEALSQVSLYGRDCNDLKIKIATIKNLITELSSGRNTYLEQVRDFVRQRGKAFKEREEMQEEQKTLRRKIERTRFWIKGFKDVQLYVITEVLQELEFVSNAMLADIGLEDWQIKFSIEKETQAGTLQSGLHVTILSPSNDKPVRWKCWSGGEGQRLRLVGALALSDVLLNHAGVTTNLEILDEPTSHLSQEGVRDLLPFLAERARANNKIVFLVDHMAVQSSDFSSVTTVVKNKKQESMIKYDEK
jgi:DNA repair exonuclease SbcCD ATPase subunit